MTSASKDSKEQPPTPPISNTYILPTQVFPVAAVKKEVLAILKEHFETKDENKSNENRFKTAQELGPVENIAKSVSTKIMDKFKDNRNIVPDRFKIAVEVTVTDQMQQAVLGGAACLWDPEHDNYVTVNLDTGAYVVIVNVFGCLQE